jgi:hypothetical protein
MWSVYVRTSHSYDFIAICLVRSTWKNQHLPVLAVEGMDSENGVVEKEDLQSWI